MLSVKASSEQDQVSLLSQLHSSTSGFGFLSIEALQQLEITKLSEYAFEIESEYPSLGIEFFEMLSESLHQLDGLEFKTRLFDSASGGVSVWQQPEEDEIDLDGALVSMLDIDEDEGLHEALEDAGAIIVNSFDEKAVLIIYLEDESLLPLKDKIKASTSLVHQDDFWDEFEYLAM